ncbi:hypothetical protein BDQ12DRAFT_738768 [Crucibulum laeve]|uniref:F-box domain-containing protein n=1 Tax=Crucibulum laeve TaxID=68775 RepID=A0A5C3LXF9_9AGAR|nr:hypothetical protein BDQ12DRAFT_738768 [Crucibulum laeve]
MTSLARCLLESLPLDIWERIAFYAIASDETFLGPPCGITTLCLISRRIHKKISLQENSHLYAKLFLFKFDPAPEERFSERWTTTRCLTAELIKRMQTLKRLKAKEFEANDLWTCYLMLSESKGKNESQLLDWAHFKSYLTAVAIVRAQISSPVAWFRHPTSDALTVWLLWMISSREDVKNEEPEFFQLLNAILHAFNVIGYRHPSAYAPDTCFKLPLCEHVEQSQVFNVSCPPVSDIVHYSHKLTIAAPPVTSGAMLLYAMRKEAFQDDQTFPSNISNLPVDRAAAVASHREGPTIQDIIDFHYQNRVQAMERVPRRIISDFEQYDCDYEQSPQTSRRYEEDWYRCVGCSDLWASDSPLRGIVFKPGTLSGSWAGRFLQPDFQAHLSVLVDSRVQPTSIQLHHKPLYWTLREHHCLYPEQPLLPGLERMDNMERGDVLNAWLPRGIRINHLEDAIEALDPASERRTRYETFLPRSVAPYSKAACEKLERLETRWISDDSDEEIAEDISGVELGSANPDANFPDASYINDDDEYADMVLHRDSGISDILVTGETGEYYGNAWGHYNIIGRVRSWDGFVVLLRTPRDENQQYLGTWIFKGYIHGRNFVGRWRETSTPVDMIGFEGGFVVCKTEAA